MKKLALAVSIVAASAVAASAADLRSRPHTKAPAEAAEVFNWTGFYVGGNVGGAWENETGTSNFVSSNTPAAQTNTPQSNSLQDRAVIGGVHAGYNWQMARWVFGVEADWDWTHTKNGFCRQTDNLSAACSDNGRGFLTLNGKTAWLGSARGRLGYVWDRFMIYGTGGAAWGKFDASINASCLAGGCGLSLFNRDTTASFAETKMGWVAGGGIEAMLDADWIVRAEYLHYDLGNITNTLTLVTPTAFQQSATWSRDFRYETVRVGLSYKFGGLAAAGY
jgi:outer membrane immunogenic protein